MNRLYSFQNALSLTAAALVVFASFGQAQGALINEIRTDHAGSDTDEFFEINGVSGESLDGLAYIVIGDGASPSPLRGTIEHVTLLDGLSIPADGFFLAAESSYTGSGSVDLTTAINFENNDTYMHVLVRGFTGANGDDLDTNDDGTLDILPWASIVDGLGLIHPTSPDFDYSAQLGIASLGPHGADDGEFEHAFRIADGSSAWVGGLDNSLGAIGVTEGVSNVPEPTSLVLFGLAVIGLAGSSRRRDL